MNEWTAIKYWTEYCSITNKTADKGSCVVVRGRKDDIVVAEKQLGDINISADVVGLNPSIPHGSGIKVLKKF